MAANFPDKAKLIAVTAAVFLTVLVGAGAGLYFTGMFGLAGNGDDGYAAADAKNQAKDSVELGASVYHDLPEMTVDLKTGQCRAPFLKFQATIQIAEEHRPLLQERQPKIIDRVQTHLRDQERRDLVGKAGAERLRGELVSIVNNTLRTVQVCNVLFKTLVLQ